MITLIDNGKVVTRDSVVPGGVLVENGRIAKILYQDTNDSSYDERIDAEGLYISPGFIDAHIHGANGNDVMDATPEAIEAIGQALEPFGLTGFAPTTYTHDAALIRKACDAIRVAMKRERPGADILGIHLEGPFLSERFKGAQNSKHLLLPTVENYLALSGGNQQMLRVSMAPELPGAETLAAYLTAQNILVSAAHTDAGYADMMKGLNAGFRHATHMYNGMSGIKSPDFYCQAGCIESVLLLDGYQAEVICDGRHIPSELIQLLIRCKGIQNVMLTSDASVATMFEEGEYIMCGVPVVVEDHVCMLRDRSSFCGSVATPDMIIRNAVKNVGLRVPDAVRMLSYNVAKSIGLEHERGELAEGKLADIVLFDEDIRIHRVMRAKQFK